MIIVPKVTRKYLLKKIRVITGLQNNPLRYQLTFANHVEVLEFRLASRFIEYQYSEPFLRRGTQLQ